MEFQLYLFKSTSKSVSTNFPPTVSNGRCCAISDVASLRGHPLLDTPQGGPGAWQLVPPGKLGSLNSPAALRLSPASFLKLSLLSFCCYLSLLLQVNEINTSSPGGGRGWSVVRTTTNITSKMFARLRATAQKEARGRADLNISIDKKFHPPSTLQQALPAFCSDFTSKRSWLEHQAACSPPCNATKSEL